MTVITLYALFGDDIRILVTDSGGDPVFWIMNIIAMFAFTMEIIIILGGSALFCSLLLSGLSLIENNWLEKWMI